MAVLVGGSHVSRKLGANTYVVGQVRADCPEQSEGVLPWLVSRSAPLLYSAWWWISEDGSRCWAVVTLLLPGLMVGVSEQLTP